MQEPTTELQSQLAVLEHFILENDDLPKLEGLVGRFNIFDALNIARVEIRHSNFLAWLLDPAESHGQGSLFFRAVVMDLFRRAPIAQRPMSPVELDGIELGAVEIRREWRNIDILITCESPRFVIAIENKTYSGEHGSQLDRYKQMLSRDFTDWPSLKVFMTTDGSLPSDDDWVPYSYANLYRALSRCCEASHDVIGTEVLVFINHYLGLIGTRFMDKSEIVDLCKRIYKNHRTAIDLIIEHGRASVFQEVVMEIVQAGGHEILCSNSGSVWFLPPSLKQVIPENGVAWTHLDRKVSVAFWMVAEKDGVRLIFEICAMSDATLRLKLVNELKNAGFAFKKKAFDLGAKFSRFYSQKEAADMDDRQSVQEAAQQCIKHVAEQLPAVLKVCQRVF